MKSPTKLVVPEGKKTLHDVMRKMYSGSDQLSSYDMELYKSNLESVSGESFDAIFSEIIYGIKDFKNYLIEALKVFGWGFSSKKAENISWQYGIKTYNKDKKVIVQNILENSAGDKSLIVKEDEIIAVNEFRIEDNFDNWLGYFENDEIVLKVNRNGKIFNLKILIFNT